MLNRSLTYLFAAGAIIGIGNACYQKKGPKHHHIVSSQEDEFPDDTLVDGINYDSITYVDTFQLVPTETIFKKIQTNAKKKIVYVLPKLKSGDTLEGFEYIEQLAVTNVYASVGKLSSNQKLYKASIHENADLVTKIIEDSVDFPQKVTIDSLNQWTESIITQYATQNEWVYFEAVQWLEHLYLTLEKPKNTKNLKKLEELVLLQLENGTEMLERLSAYQDYQPIVIFSDYLIDILDCKYFTFDVTQLRNEVIEARGSIYAPTESAKK